MWGRVGNPEDRFSHNEAQIRDGPDCTVSNKKFSSDYWQYEPEKNSCNLERFLYTGNKQHFVYVYKSQVSYYHLLLGVNVRYTLKHTRRVMRKLVFAICEQPRRRSFCTSTQCDQCLCVSLLKAIDNLVSIF